MAMQKENMKTHIRTSWHLGWCVPLMTVKDDEGTKLVKAARDEEENPLNIALEHMGEMP